MSSIEDTQRVLYDLIHFATVKPEDPLNDIDWEANLRICDLINGNPDVYCKPAAKAIRYQLKTNIKNERVIWLTLHLFETCVKNCGRPFHKEIATKDFTSMLKKVAGKSGKKPKSSILKGRKGYLLSSRDIHIDRNEEKALAMIQSWGALHPDELAIYSELYDKMAKKGVIFPVPQPEDKTPLHMEAKRIDHHQQYQQQRQQQFQPQQFQQPSQFQQFQPQQPQQQMPRSADIPADIRQKLEEIKAIVPLLESIIEGNPGEDLNKNELAVELRDQLIQKHQPNLNDLIQKYSNQGNNENFLNILLLLFERVEQVLARFDPSYVSNRKNSMSSHEDLIFDDEEKVKGKQETKFNSISNVDSVSSIDSTGPIRKNSSSDHVFANTNPFRDIKSEGNSEFRTPAEIGLDLLAQMKSNQQAKRVEDPLLDWLLK